MDQYYLKAAGQGGSLQVDSSRSASGMVTLKPGTVLACNWKILQLDKDTGEIKLDYILSAPKIQSESCFKPKTLIQIFIHITRRKMYLTVCFAI